jgi:SPP1 family predicted phage head-tail adaptor
MRGSFIDPGRLRVELALEQAAAVPDGLGGNSETWSEIATVMALVEPVGSTNLRAGDNAADAVTHRVTIRHRDTVAAGMRFRRDARHLAILSTHDPDETRRYLVCRCREERR